MGDMGQGTAGLVYVWRRTKPFEEREPGETFLGVRPSRGLVPTQSGRHLPVLPRVGMSTHCLGHVVALHLHPHGEWDGKYRGTMRPPHLFFQTPEERKAGQVTAGAKTTNTCIKHLPRLAHMPRALKSTALWRPLVHSLGQPFTTLERPQTL